MNAEQVLAAMVTYGLWVHPSGHGGYTATAGVADGCSMAWNYPTIEKAVAEVVREIEERGE
jgi:hypothetical protein